MADSSADASCCAGVGTATCAGRRAVTIGAGRLSERISDDLSWIDYPDPVRAADIVRRTVPGAGAALIEHATQFVGGARNLDLDKPPGVAETIDWVAALVALGCDRPCRRRHRTSLASLGALAKTPDDHALINDAFAEYSST